MPDAFEIENYGLITQIIGNTLDGDYDGDGASDYAEYIAGTSAINRNNRFRIAAARLPSGSVSISFPAYPIYGAGYFAKERRYDLLQTTNLSNLNAWSVVPGYGNLLGQGNVVTYTNLNTNAVQHFRARVWME